MNVDIDCSQLRYLLCAERDQLSLLQPEGRVDP